MQNDVDYAAKISSGFHFVTSSYLTNFPFFLTFIFLGSKYPLCQIPNVFFCAAPTTPADKQKHPFIKNTHHVENLFIWIDYKLEDHSIKVHIFVKADIQISEVVVFTSLICLSSCVKLTLRPIICQLYQSILKVGGRCGFIGDCDSSQTKGQPNTDI